MICFHTESASSDEFAYLDHVTVLLALIAADNQTVSMKHFHIVKHFLQNESLLNESVCLSENHHIYDQNVCFNIISCIFLVVFNMQYFHYFMNSEILHVDFCHHHFLIKLIDHVFNHMLDHDCEVSSDNTSF